MNPYRAYQERRATGWTRIDMVLALFDALLDRAERAAHLLRQGDAAAARPVLARARVLLGGLAAGLVPGGGEVAVNLLRLYEFVGRQLAAGTAEQVEAILPILRTVREGFQAVRPEALELERQGVIPPPDRAGSLQVSA